jgi:hypothetical protein
MNLFLLSVICVAREFFNAVDSIRQLSLILDWRFQGHQSLCFCWRFLVGCDTVFTNDFMRQMTLFSLLISFVNRELVCAVNSIRQPWLNFQRWFLVLLWLIVCLTNPCVKFKSIFAIGFMRRSWIRWRCRLHMSASLILQWRFQGQQSLCFCWRFLVDSDVVCNDDSMRLRWFCFL